MVLSEVILILCWSKAQHARVRLMVNLPLKLLHCWPIDKESIASVQVLQILEN